MIARSLADPIEHALHRVARAERRTQRIVDSICDEIRGGGERSTLRIRRVFVAPREIFRVELDRPDLGYQRTTLLGREALEALLESDGVRTRDRSHAVGVPEAARACPGAGLRTCTALQARRFQVARARPPDGLARLGRCARLAPGLGR